MKGADLIDADDDWSSDNVFHSAWVKAKSKDGRHAREAARLSMRALMSSGKGTKPRPERVLFVVTEEDLVSLRPGLDVVIAASKQTEEVSETNLNPTSPGNPVEFGRGPSFSCLATQLNEPKLGCVFMEDSTIDKNISLFEIAHRAKRVQKIVIFDRAALNTRAIRNFWGEKWTQKLFDRVVTIKSAFREMGFDEPKCLSEIESILPSTERKLSSGSDPQSAAMGLLVRGFNFYWEWIGEQNGRLRRRF
jgi:hypothetical protein